ncbi:XF1762 family protein [Chitinophaga japonensis]|uniref:Acetyltransferase (GNAT) family protein n=1 Tax=Chitinophaga japonensis TaxID=104662 RepID=A0A562SY43_CHIJA|nr:hypothetical protein LX66_3539 [Chitinophaga japonensis]
MSGLKIVPVTFREACAYIVQHHRHHSVPQGHKFSIAAKKGDSIAGVAVVGRPVSRYLDDGLTAEVTRLCSDGTKNVCSMLYAACWRAARAMGYTKLITYTLDTEPGTSLSAAGWKCAGPAGGGSWNVPSRPRQDKAPIQSKIKYYICEP